MKKFATVLAVAVLGLFAAGCASTFPVGSCYTNLKLPVTATSNAATPAGKIGIATCTSWFGVYVNGDLSLETAMKNGNITKVHYIDWDVQNILGYGKYKLVVHGE